MNSCSHDGKYLTSGSENQCVFLWRTQYESANITARKDRNNFYEAIKGDDEFRLRLYPRGAQELCKLFHSVGPLVVGYEHSGSLT